ncbi:hypothetical protein D9758_016472 [Tetrapyrgos nigripes]|uniref:HMG box domain-containing protein n=1 Tax=Tetrapyrgos nigripes TaxID=182062 RepID=A0A8H5FP85_9AGAR|nr:hypothetical protein D9758_016472 [Tetrapyrgos nigripes]
MPKSSSKTTKDKPAGEKKEKRPPSAYNLYIKNNSAKWKEENPGKKQSEMMKEMAVLWKDAAHIADISSLFQLPECFISYSVLLLCIMDIHWGSLLRALALPCMSLRFR